MEKSEEAMLVLGRAFPSVADLINRYHESFAHKQLFGMEILDDGAVLTMRDDYRDRTREAQHGVGHQLTISEYDLMTKYHGLDEYCEHPQTTHEVVVSSDYSMIFKKGNPFRNNAAYDFTNALEIKYFRGIIEMEVPLGFVIYPDRSRMDSVFFKYLDGHNLYSSLKSEKPEVIRAVTWEVAKLLSRLIRRNVLFYDSHRFNNYFIEAAGSQKLFRLLDAEYILPRESLEDEEKEYMVKRFANEALKHPALLDRQRLEDFLMVCLGDVAFMKHCRDSLDNLPDICMQEYFSNDAIRSSNTK